MRCCQSRAQRERCTGAGANCARVAAVPDPLTEPLTHALGAVPPATVLALPPAVRERLAQQVLSTQAQQQVFVEESVATALKGVPLPVRGIVKKALGG